MQHALGSESTLLFLHIPKAAGSSLSRVLGHRFRPEEIYPTPIPPELKQEAEVKGWRHQVVENLRRAHEQFDPEDSRKYRLMLGHWDYGIRKRAPWLIPITMLREPIARLVSNYRFVSRANDQWTQPLFRKIHDQRLNLRGFYSDEQVRRSLRNWQTRQVAGYIWSTFGSLPPDDELLAMAKDHLTAFPFVGLTERFRESVLLLSYTFAWPPIKEYRSVNISPADDTAEVTPETRELLLELSKLDIELYKYATELYNTRLSEMLKTLCSEFRASEKAPSVLTASCPQAPVTEPRDGRDPRAQTEHDAADPGRITTYAKQLFNDELVQALGTLLARHYRARERGSA